MGHHDFFPLLHPLRQVRRGDGGGGGGDGLQIRAAGLNPAVDLILDLQLLRNAFEDDLRLPEPGVLLGKGQQALAGSGLFLRHQSLGDEVLVISPVFLQPRLAVFGQHDGGDAVSGEEYS